MFGDLPPNSSVTRLRAWPAFAPISRPTAVEPVNAILSHPGWSTSAAPVSPSPVSTFSTPGGNPASRASSPRRSALSGVCSAGLSTTVQPAARAGRELPDRHQQREVPRHDLPAHADRLAARVAVHVRRRHRQHVALDLRRPAREVAQVRARCRRRPRTARAPPACRCPPTRSARVPRRDLPGPAPAPPSRARVRWGASCAHGPSSNASRAARTARSTSSPPACGTCAISRPVAGSSVANVRPSAAAGRSEPISRVCGPR